MAFVQGLALSPGVVFAKNNSAGAELGGGLAAGSSLGK